MARRRRGGLILSHGSAVRFPPWPYDVRPTEALGDVPPDERWPVRERWCEVRADGALMCGRLDLRLDSTLYVPAVQRAAELGRWCGALDDADGSREVALGTSASANHVPPMRPLPLLRADDALVMARWGWPGSGPRSELLLHARIETAPSKPTWSAAWRVRRGVVPVAGWYEGSWHVAAPGAHLAVLWIQAGPDDLRVVMLTQPPPPDQHIERFPIPLTAAGALAWLAGAPPEQQLRDLTVRGDGGQQTIFDV